LSLARDENEEETPNPVNRSLLLLAASACLAVAHTTGCAAAATGSESAEPGEHIDTKDPPAAPADATTPKPAPITTAGFAEISGHAANDVWAVGSMGVTAHYDGKKWSLVPSGTDINLLGVWTAGEGEAWTVGDSEVMLRWDGKAWSQVLAPGSGVLIGIWGSGQSDVWAVGIDEGTAFFRRWDGAEWQYNWLNRPSFWDVWGSGPNDVWTVGSSGPGTGHVFRYDGEKMNQMDYDGPPLRSITGTSADDVWIVAQANPVEHWNGTAWEVPPSPEITGTLIDVWAVTPSDVWACGTDGQMLHYDGSSWTAVPSDTMQTLQGIWGTSADDIWAVGAAGTIVHYDGKSWSSVFPPVPPAPPPF
jgi:hypothetical protein